ncbi:hypothetical protein VM1G_00829 [Cytospora mali]|uniref:Uncharacterized protein n=1 Tax=Cytospora mali TaxID=578113 RepID=A0A194VM56_CYTMA|nr:hypothetical protein VM1G_00829 [Valsa mali]
MEGLKIIAQSTFDKHQKFWTGSGGAHRYSVIEIGAFGSPQSASSTKTSNKTQSTENLRTSSEAGAGNKYDVTGEGAVAAGIDETGASRVSFNEWMVYEDDLVAFMTKRPVEPVTSAATHIIRQNPAAEIGKGKTAGRVTSSPATSATGHSRSVSLQSSKTVNTTATTATTATSAGKLSERSASEGKEEVEAAASLKLICIPRATLEGDSDAETNTLAISREAFLHLYVDTMDADHGALYFLARGYDGFHEYNDPSKGTVTVFIGTADYALVWTFRRPTLETRGFFIDRRRPQQPKDPGSGSNQHTTSTSRKSSKGGPVAMSNAWLGFRGMLKMYKSYIYAPHLLSFVSCLHMLHAFDDQVSASDVPQVKEIESRIVNGTKGKKEEDENGSDAISTLSKLQAISRQSSVFTTPVSTEQSFFNIPPETPKPFNNEKLVTWAQASGEITDSISRKLRQLKMAKEMLDLIAREHETVIADVVAPAFLDRYHWAMEGINEAIPVVERHMASLEESMHDLKARTERLIGLGEWG